jgi:type I restriction enzyme S subunit
MNDHTIALLERHFDTAFTAPDGVKKLRELILTLAMQGKLVPQDPKDDPASELLKQIEAEKERLIREGKIKKSKPVPAIKPEEVPYDLPDSWEWVRIRNICHEWGQKTPDSLFTYIDVGSIDNKLGVISDNTQVIESSDAPSRARKIVKLGTIIYSTVRPYLLNIAIVDREFNPEPIASTAFAIIHPLHQVSNKLIYYYLRSPVFINYVETTMKGVAYPAINDGDFFGGLFPLPPLAEQRRIVAKIDELMGRCDELEKLQRDRDRMRLDVHTAAIEQLLKAKQDTDFNTAWSFLSQNFNELYAVKENVAELRKAILQLAVMGKLVPQDSNDEPASELLEKLRRARLDLYESNNKNNPEIITMIRKLNKLSLPVTAPFELPKTWIAVHLLECCEYLVDCHNKTATYQELGIPIIRTTNIRDRQIRYQDMKYVGYSTYEFWARRCPPLSGDIIFTREAPMGEAAIIPKGMTCCLGQRTMLIRPMHKFICNKYLLIALTEPHLLERASSEAIGSTVKHLRVGDVEELSIPLPPLAEQRRIVAKIDKLMALCDELDRAIEAATNQQTALLDAVMAKL